MNIEIANRLLEYRKKSGLSQEELAEKLNISRQSVSKWERAESSPDTDNLIELAKIYNVTLDDLLNVDKPMSEEVKEQDELKDNKEEKIYKNLVILNEDEDYSNSKDEDVKFTSKGLKVEKEGKEVLIPYEEVYVKDKNENIPLLKSSLTKNYEPSLKAKRIKDAINGALVLVLAILYVSLCGFKVQDWGQFWIVFVAYPCLASLVEAIFKKDVKCFAFPIFITVIYLILGLYFNLWHPFWFLFLLIPVYYPIIDLFKKKVTICYYDNNEEVSLLISKGDVYLIKEN